MMAEDQEPMLQKPTNSGQHEKIGFRFALTIMICNSFGSAIVIMPHLMDNLDPFNWAVMAFLIVTILVFCGVLLKESLTHMIMQATDNQELIERESWRMLASYAMNVQFSKVVKWTKYIALTANTFGVFLTAASCLNLAIPLDLEHYNRVRVCLVICYIVATPFMLYGSYKDMIKHSILGISTSTLSLLSVTVICCLYLAHDGVSDSKKNIPFQEVSELQALFTSFGAILYAAAGPAITAPSIMVNYKDPGMFHQPYMLAYSVIFGVYVICASIPYFTFKGRLVIEQNLLDTLDNRFIKENASVVYKVLVTIVKIPLSIHLMTSGVFFMNPVFQSMESKLKLPRDFTWKRVALRVPVLVALLVVSLIIPFFAPIISLVGAVPLTMLLIIFPIVTFYFLFDNIPLFSKIVMVTIAVVCISFMFGNLYYNILLISRIGIGK